MTPLLKELMRKLVHLFQLPIIVGYSFLHFYYSPRLGLFALTMLLLILLEIEYFRIDYPTSIGNEIKAKISKFILRKHERNNVISSVFFTISTIISFSVFDYSVALIALCMTVFGDLAAALAGRAFGKKKLFRNKSYVGTFAGLFMNCIVGLALFPEHPQLWVPMALVASIVEALTQKLDDNLTVPLFSGFTGQLIVFFFHIQLSIL